MASDIEHYLPSVLIIWISSLMYSLRFFLTVAICTFVIFQNTGIPAPMLNPISHKHYKCILLLCAINYDLTF